MIESVLTRYAAVSAESLREVYGIIDRWEKRPEDASLAAFYLISLALGVLIVSTRGSNVDLMHVLFGSVLALDNAALILLCSFASISVLVLAVIFRLLVMECADPQFLRFKELLSTCVLGLGGIGKTN